MTGFQQSDHERAIPPDVEAVARAICISRGSDPDRVPFGEVQSGWPMWRDHVHAAKAAITALASLPAVPQEGEGFERAVRAVIREFADVEAVVLLEENHPRALVGLTKRTLAESVVRAVFASAEGEGLRKAAEALLKALPRGFGAGRSEALVKATHDLRAALAAGEPAPRVTDEMVERAARTIYAMRGRGFIWERLGRDSRAYYIEVGRAAVEAALGAQEDER